MQLTVVVPTVKCDPEGGVQLEVAPEQLSLRVAWKVTVAKAEFGSVPIAMLDGQVMDGACVSLTVTVKVQVEVLLAVSVAVQVTVVVPTANCVPEAGEQVLVTPGQLSVAVGEA